MKYLTLRSALTLPTALVFAALTWGCDDSAQNPVAPSQTQAGAMAGSDNLVTALHGPDCKGHHKNDAGCGGGGGGDDDASLLDVAMSDGFVMASTPMRVKRNNNKALNLEDSATVDINFGSLLDPLNDPNPSCELSGPGPGGNPTPNMAELRATFTVQNSSRDLSIQIDKKASPMKGAIRALPLGVGPGENWFSFCFNTGLGLCNVAEGTDVEGNLTYTLTGSGARAVHGGWALMCPNDGSNGLASVTITVKPVS